MHKFAHLSLLALLAGYFAQIGAQIFAITVLVRMAASAPPHSLSIYQGEYPYDSGGFWSTMPMITGALFILAILTNWQTPARWLIVAAFALFVGSGIYQGLIVAPLFDRLVDAGFAETIDVGLQQVGRSWLVHDTVAWAISLAGGLLVFLAVFRRLSRLLEVSSQ